MYVGLRRGLRACAAIAVLVLAGCGATASDRAPNQGPYWDPWISGGQTGSLIPRCGLPEAGGVPASSAGFVIYASECEGSAFAPSELSVRDAAGRSIDFEVEVLSRGAVLITPVGALAPGTYSVSTRDGEDDEDAGVEGDSDAGSEPSPVAAPAIEQELQVDPVAPSPTRLGTVIRVGEACSPTFEIALDPLTAAHASLLALDVQVDGIPVRPFIAYGTLEVSEGGSALVTLPEDLWVSLGYGEHTLTWIARLAGQDAPLAVIEMPLAMECRPSEPSPWSEQDSQGACSIGDAARTRSGAVEGFAIALACAVLGRRRRKRS